MRIVRNPLGRSTREFSAEPVTEIIDQVRRKGDAAVLDLTERFDHAQLGPDQLRVDPNELEASIGVLEPDVLNGLRTAIANVKAVAKAQVRDEPVTVALAEGHTVEIVEHPVRRAAVYVPGGRAPVPVDRRDGRGDGTGRGRPRDRRVRPARPGRQGTPGDPGRVRALRGDRGVPDGRCAGHRRARIRHRVGEGC